MNRSASQSSRKRLLFVAYLFPPTGGVGVQRVRKFVKYLPEFGWDVTVLTAENPSVPLRDESLLDEIPPQTVIRTAKTFEPGYAVKKMVTKSSEGPVGLVGRITLRLKSLARTIVNAVLQPDTAILWYPRAVREGLRILKEQHHNAIIVTAPPFSGLLVGAALAQQSGLPLILDYRDEWTISNAYWENKQQGRISNWVQKRMQQRALRAARTVIATTPGSAAAIAKLAVDAGSKAEVTHIYNGFDPTDFPATDERLQRKDYGNGTDRLRIAFVGTSWALTTIESFVKAVQILASRHPHLLDHLEVIIAGRQVGEQVRHLETLASLPCHFKNLGFLEHAEALRLMVTSDWLLQLQSDLPGLERVISSKLFEYMGAKRPILAITGEGDQCDVVRRHPGATVCSQGDPAAIAEVLATRLEAHRCGVSIDAVTGDVTSFERRQLTSQLAEVLDSLLTKTSAKEDVRCESAPLATSDVPG